MKINIKNILYLPLILLFLPSLVVPIGGIYVLLYQAVVFVLLIFLLIKDQKKFIINIREVANKTPLKIFFLLTFLIVCDMFFLLLIGRINLSRLLISTFWRLGFFILPMFLYFIYITKEYIPVKKLIKTFVFLFWINLLVGFIAYTGQYFNIEIINNAFDVLANARVVARAQNGLGDLTAASNYIAFGLPRLDNLHQEPSEYAHFLCMYLPLIYAVSESKNKICKQKFLNAFIKATLVPFTLLSIILTFSPTGLILSLILTFIYYFSAILNLLKKYSLPLLIFIGLLVLIFGKIDLSNTYLSRITNVLTNIHSFDDFIIVEGSLATRIVCSVNTMCIFFHYPILGIGFGNLTSHMYNQFLNSPVPVTQEIIRNMHISTIQNADVMFTNDYLYTFLAENGIIIFSVLAYFYYRLYKFCSKVKLMQIPYYSIICKGLWGCLISSFLVSLYNMTVQALHIQMYFIWIVVICIIYQFKSKRLQLKNSENTDKNEGVFLGQYNFRRKLNFK